MGVSDKGDMQNVQCWGGSRNEFGNPCPNRFNALPLQKIGVSRIFKEINTFIQKYCIKLIKSESKYIYIVNKELYFI